MGECCSKKDDQHEAQQLEVLQFHPKAKTTSFLESPPTKPEEQDISCNYFKYFY